MARKVFFIALAFVPLVCILSLVIPAPAGSDAAAAFAFRSDVGRVSFYVMIGLVVIALGAAVYDRVSRRSAPREKKAADHG